MVTATRTCLIHQQPMTERVSKKTGKPYWSHSVGRDLCFGDDKGGNAASGTSLATSQPLPAGHGKPDVQAQTTPAVEVFKGFVNWGDLVTQAMTLAANINLPPQKDGSPEPFEKAYQRAFRIICEEIREQAAQ